MAITKVRVKINGTWTNLTKNSFGKWTGSVTAPASTSYNQSGGYFPITVEATNSAGTVTTVDATDTTLGSVLRLVVRETTKPVIKLVQPSNGAYISNNQLPIIFEVTDETSGSGVNASTVALKLAGTTYKDGSTGMSKTAITDGYRFTFTPQAALSDGAKAIEITASDHDGNAAAKVTASYTVDTVPPTLTISSPQDGLATNQKNVVLTGITNDTLSSPVTVTVMHGSASYTPAVANDGSFSQALVLTEGVNTIKIVSTDATGKSTTINLAVTLDTSVPTIKSATFAPNPVNASASVQITLEVE